MRTDSSTKRLHQALALNATSNGGDASRVGKICNFYLAEFVFPSFLYPDARRVAPIRGSVLRWRLVLEETQALMGATRLASGKMQLLFSRACILFFHFPDARRVAPIRGSVFLQRVSGNLKCPKTVSFLMPFLNTLPVHCYVAPQPCNAKKYIFALYCARLALTLLRQVRRRLGNTKQKF